MRADDAASSPAPGAGEAAEPDDYPPSPSGPLPPSGATTRYTLQVVLVLMSLLAFLGFYLALLAGTAWLVYASVAVVAWASGKAVVLTESLDPELFPRDADGCVRSARGSGAA